MSQQLHIAGVIALVAVAVPVPALAAEPADLPALEWVWHGCVRDACDRQPERDSRPGRERNALDECKPHEDAYVAARSDADLPWVAGRECGRRTCRSWWIR